MFRKFYCKCFKFEKKTLGIEILAENLELPELMTDDISEYPIQKLIRLHCDDSTMILSEYSKIKGLQNHRVTVQ